MPEALLKRTGVVRTDMHCTHCSKNFIAAIDHSLDGNHIVECPHCRHEHCRVITNGKVTGDRWDSRMQRVDIPPARVWQASNQPIVAGTASAFLRDRWLNRADYG